VTFFVLQGLTTKVVSTNPRFSPQWVCPQCFWCFHDFFLFSGFPVGWVFRFQRPLGFLWGLDKGPLCFGCLFFSKRDTVFFFGDFARFGYVLGSPLCVLGGVVSGTANLGPWEKNWGSNWVVVKGPRFIRCAQDDRCAETFSSKIPPFSLGLL